MIDHLRKMAVFVHVVDAGSFRGAADNLGLAPSRMSETVSDLENHLGVTLLYRSTRKISLTEEGKILYAKSRKMLDAAESGLDAINLRSGEPVGELRVSAPAFVTQTGLMENIAEFVSQYPRVELLLNFSDRPRDLLQEGFDIAIRAESFASGDYLSQSIGETNRILVASPKYLASLPPLNTPNDLEECKWIRYEMRESATDLISKNGETVSIFGKSTVMVDSADALREFAILGLGVTPLPEHMARRGIEHKELVQLLPDWELYPLRLHATWPDRTRTNSLSFLFIKFLAQKTNTPLHRLLS